MIKHADKFPVDKMTSSYKAAILDNLNGVDINVSRYCQWALTAAATNGYTYDNMKTSVATILTGSSGVIVRDIFWALLTYWAK